MLRMLIAFLLGLIIALVAGPLWIPFFRRLKFGQYIREDGPQAHLAKQGTPTFGGAIFLSSMLVASIALHLNNTNVLSVITMTLGFAFVGLVDDYIIVVKKDNRGLKPAHKMLAFLVLSLVFYGLFFRMHISHFYGDLFQLSGIAWLLVFVFITLATTNATNLTDGIDGLCGSVTLVVSLFFSLLAYRQELTMLMEFNLVFSGALIAYLVYNWHPAKVFMGDMGSLAIGAYVVANATILGIEWFIPIFGFVYLAETVSVILQVFSFKTTGKRIFKMAPIHHHFEAVGWSEKQIVFRFTGLTLVLSLLTLFLCK